MNFTIFTTNSGNKNRAGNNLHPGQLDPRPLTAGPVATLEGQAGLVGWAMAQADRLSVAGDGRPWRARRREKRRRKGGGRTGGSPGTRRWWWLGRRRAGGCEFGGRAAQFLAR
jgi:hypothetical protein